MSALVTRPEAAEVRDRPTAHGLAPEANAGTRGVARRWVPRVLWVVGIAAGAVALRAALPELREGLAALDRAQVGPLAAAVGLEIVALATLPLTFRAALRMFGGGAGYPAALDGTLGAFALSRVVPGGGLAGGLYAARRFVRAGNGAGVAAAAVAVASTATMLTLGLVVAGGALWEIASGRGALGLLWSLGGLVVVLAAAGAVLVSLLAHPDRLDRTCTRLAALVRRPALAQTWRDQLQVLAPAAAQPVPLLRVAGWSALNWGLQLAALWMIFAAFGVSMPVGTLILGFGAANLVTALPHTPGGLGVVEAGMTATYVALGVPMGTALLGVLCYRLLAHWLPVLVALPLVLPGVRRASEKVEQ